MSLHQIVMIVMLASTDGRGGVAVSEHAFASTALCQKAAELVMKVPRTVGYAYAFCVETGR